MKVVLFACVHNAGRSQMAAALFNKMANPTKAKAVSAGTSPADQVHPNAINLMKEIGIDISQEKPRKISLEMLRKADILVTMGCEESCPILPSVEHIKWEVSDTYMESSEEARRIRDQLLVLIQSLIKDKGFK